MTGSADRPIRIPQNHHKNVPPKSYSEFYSLLFLLHNSFFHGAIFQTYLVLIKSKFWIVFLTKHTKVQIWSTSTAQFLCSYDFSNVQNSINKWNYGQIQLLFLILSLSNVKYIENDHKIFSSFFDFLSFSCKSNWLWEY